MDAHAQNAGSSAGNPHGSHSPAPGSPSYGRRHRGGRGFSVRPILIAAYSIVVLVGLVFLLADPETLGFPAEAARVVGVIGLLLAMTIAPVAFVLEAHRCAGTEGRLERKLEELTQTFRTLASQTGLSDDARRVLNRQTERELLCRAIEEDITAQDWDAGLVLCRELADRFGYRAEAEGFRARIEGARAAVLERNVTDAIAHLDGLIVQRRWDDAVREAGRIGRLFPDSPRVEGLRHRVEQARTVYKADLERRFLQAAEANRIDEAMLFLKELDGYLTANEAEPYREVARGVIGKARENLGAQFKIAVQDGQWATAAAIGRRIINEFPNTRMATEVRELLDSVLAKANATAGV